MPRPKSTLKKYPSTIRSNSPKRIILFNNNINDIINKFENSQKTPHVLDIIKPMKTSHRDTRSNDYHLNAYSGKLNSSNRKTKLSSDKRNWWNKSGFKMVDSVGDDVIDNNTDRYDNDDHNEIQNNDDQLIETDDAYSNVEIIDEINYDYMPLNAEADIRPTKLMRLRNMNIIRCQLNMFQRFVGILLSFPFFSSVNGAGLSTLTCAFFLPRFLCENIMYPIFRLILGTLYPAYASYKAVRNKDVKDYVSNFEIYKKFLFLGWFS